MPSSAGPGRRLALFLGPALLAWGLLAATAPAWAQDAPARRLSARELNYLLMVAREPLAALQEGRPVREPKQNRAFTALSQALPMVVTLRLDGEILARAWEIRQPLALIQGAMALAGKALESPDQGRPPTPEEWPGLKVAVAVLHSLSEAADDREVGPGQAVVVLEGFRIGVGLPRDLPQGYRNFDLLSKACEMAGLRPQAWLLPGRCSILASDVDEMVER
ncbi:MAG: hypothetical protein LBL95_06915 [Deltaproteobacteria bacterium]|jgi:hypothetical protein|nr:hypothetical protein [Deltaproteobacteria bacterium]